MSDNPLLRDCELPPFSAIHPAHVVPAVTEVIDDNRRSIAALLDVAFAPDWRTLVQPLEDLAERLNNVFSRSVTCTASATAIRCAALMTKPWRC